jgi:hypothetical protein
MDKKGLACLADNRGDFEPLSLQDLREGSGFKRDSEK